MAKIFDNMHSMTQHTGRLSYRRISAVILTVVYLVIALSPLASFALQSKKVMHAITGECAGDCAICGCSPESRAARTCCCARKNNPDRFSLSDPADAEEPECCRKIREENTDHNAHDHHNSSQEEPSRTVTVFKCGCPCNGGDPFSLATIDNSEIIPYAYSIRIALPHNDTRFPLSIFSAVSHAPAPPEPPPQLLIPA